ncbi:MULTISPECIES: hypothetical protein [Paenibacillus]|uniref:hypothetical protein n=1 Tax=Paenibacillus TaxID=44249 RepID=UPI0015960778|nr:MULTISPECIES: hypothetical protein [Paenibacillus]
MSTENNNQPTKAEVQTTQLNKMPIPGENETHISEEEVAEAFQQQSTENRTSGNQQS